MCRPLMAIEAMVMVVAEGGADCYDSKLTMTPVMQSDDTHHSLQSESVF